MNDGNHTGNAQKLPLAERARQGLLAGEPELSLLEILALEHPTDPQARRALGAAIQSAIQYGDLAAREQRHEQRRLVQPLMHPPGTWTLGAGDPPPRLVTDVSVSCWIEKEAYRQWRAQCPASLLSALSQIQKWLGAPAADRLPLAERARRGLLASEPELPLSEILALEFPLDNPQAPGPDYRRWQRAIETAEARGLLKAVFVDVLCQGKLCPSGEFQVERESYRAWRNRQSSAPVDSDISLWLGATPAVETSLPESLPESSLPEPPAIVATALTESQQDKRDCQDIARALWAEQPAATQSDLLKHPRIKPYLNQWHGKNTVPGWLSEVDPRPKEQRRGRPRKTPV